jgi:transposase InsO family protein
MPPIISAFGSLLSFRFRSRASLELEVIALRHQLKHLRRRFQQRTIDLTWSDRIFWMLLYQFWPGATSWVAIIKPATLIEWHRRGFLHYWRARSLRQHSAWKVKGQLRRLIIQMYNENAGWGAGRIQGELLKLGYRVTKQTVAKYLAVYPLSPPPGWRTFFRNHMHDAAAVDMFVVFTLSYKLIYAMVVIELNRRSIIHIDAAERPSQEWLATGVEIAFQRRRKLRYLIRDRDALYGRRFRERLCAKGIRERVIAKQAPWQNIYVERLIHSIRRECLNHVIVLNCDHLQRLLASYATYYNRSRSHQALDQECPEPRPVQPTSAGARVIAIPEVGGLHHRYERRTA